MCSSSVVYHVSCSMRCVEGLMRNARVASRGVDLSERHPSRLHFCTSLPEVKQLPALVTIVEQFVHVPFTPHPMTPTRISRTFGLCSSMSRHS